MGSCGKSSILDDASSGSVIEQHSRAEFPLQSIPVQRSCPLVTCNALDTNVEHSNMMEGRMISSREVHTGCASSIVAPEMSRDSWLMAKENDNTDRLQCSGTVVSCNAVDSNVKRSNMIEGCMNSSGEVHTGSSSSTDVPQISGDSLLMENKSENTVSLQRYCPVVTSNVSDSNAEHSNMIEGSVDSSREVHTGSASPVDATEVPKDSLLMVNKNGITDISQQSCPVVTSNVLDSNVGCSNMMEGCMNLSREVHTGSAVSIDVQDMSRDSLLTVNKNENTGTRSVVASNVSDSDVECSNMAEGYMNSSREVHSGSASPINALEMPRNSLLENKSGNTDILQQSCLVVTCNALDSNVEHPNLLEGCIHSTREMGGSIDAPEAIRDSLLMENKSENTDLLQQSCLAVTCNALDSNVERSNMMEGCMNSSREVHTGPASPIDVLERSEDSLLMVNKSENTEMSLLEKTSENESQTCPSIFCAQIKLSNLENVRLVSEGKPHAKDGLKMPSDFILTSGSPKDCVHQDGHKDEKSNIFHSEGEKDAGLPTGFLVYYDQQSEQEDPMRNANQLLEGVNEGDLICGIEADAYKQTHSQGSEVPTDVIYTEAEATSDQKDGDDENSPDEDFVDKESIINTHVQVFSSPGHERILGSLPVTCSSSEAIHSDKEKGIDDIDTDFDAEGVVKVKEKNNDVSTEINVEMKNNMPKDDNACKFNDSSSKTHANCTLRKTFPPESDLPSVDYISISSPRDVPDLLKEVNGSISYNSLVGDSGEADCIRKDIIQVDYISEGNYSGNASLPIRRNSRRSKSSHKTQTKRASRKCKNKTSVPLLGGDMKMILEAARRKRSCFSKPARSSIWGLVGNINKFFEQDNDIGVDQVMCQGLGKVRGARKSGTRNKKGAISSSLSSTKKCCASTTRVRLKIKLGKEVHLSCSDVLVPDVMNGSCSASNAGPGPGSQERNSNAGNKCSEAVEVGKSESLTNSLDEDALVLNGQMANHHFEAAATEDKSDEVTEQVLHMISPESMIEPLRETRNDKGMDPGTSPDSEVINSVPEVQGGERHQQGLHDSILGSSIVSAGGRRKKQDKLTSSSSSVVEDGSQGPPRKNKSKHSKNRGRKKNPNDVVCSMSLHTSTSINAVSYSVSHKELSSESLPPSGEIELEDSAEALKVKNDMKVETTCSPNDNYELSARSSGRKLPKSLTSCKIITPKSKASNSMSRKKTGSRRREKQLKPIEKSEVKGKAVSEKVISEAEDCAGHVDGSGRLDDVGKTNAGDNKVSVNGSNLDTIVSTGLGEQHPSLHNAWVRCDDCHKWRRIPVELADLIEEKQCTWTCKDSNDKAFSDCSIPQEKSNAEINAELGLSDASGEEDAYEGRKKDKKLEYHHPTVHQESTFTHVLTNEFLHRSRKTQTIDEIMVCHCKPPSEGRFGCGDECLNRMLNIECVQGTCPCGDLCSNQQFQQRKYASLTWFKCGKKGYGLRAVDDISKGKFLIEYVGEVLDMHAYEARQREYAFKGHRHFYFMTLNGSEVIDASAKGNLGRFINHSCDPNCRTEKWMVNGEICIGLFALRDIKQGEEVTFDYNYVRVFGAAAKKCYCSSPLCRGYIGGGDPLNAEVIVQGDSDEEFPEPVMLTEGGEIEGSIPRSDVMHAERNLSKDRDLVDKSRSAQVPGNNQEENSVIPSPAISLLHCPLDGEDSMGKLPSSDMEEISQQMEDVISKSMPAVQPRYLLKPELPDNISSSQRMEASATPISKMMSNFIKNKRESKSEIVEDRPGFPKTHMLVKTSRANSSVKKGKVHANHSNGLKAAVAANRLQVASIKPKKVVEGSSNGRFEAVQEKLKELLDEDGEGGISKRKDATKGYLKLLLLTVASDDRNNGEAIQSNRDLSMILGALLKTKSRAVLNDIINKNGLQMLHNIMKQYRRDFKKTPILRKLLKVLEYLAASKILTYDHINSGPPCHGMESLRESMLSLTEHDDKQVHQIARSFRDRWIRRPFKRHGYVDRDDFKGESHRNFNCNRFSAPQNHRRELDVRPNEATDCAQQSKLVTTSVDVGSQEGCSAVSLDGCKVDGTKRRKRKSRWDQPAETISNLSSSPCKKQNVDSGLSMRADAAIDSFDGSQNITEDFPPGFSCPVQPQLDSSNASPHPVDLASQSVGNSGCPPDTVIGHLKEKFNSRMPVSYGMPLSFVQQFGTPRTEISGSWVIAPGVPFSPFPPLPPYPRDNNDCRPSGSTNSAAVDQPIEVQQRDMSGPVGCYPDDITPSTTDTSTKDVDLPHEDDKQPYKRLKDSSCDLGRKYFRQQKWNNSKIHRPWFRRNAWGSNGNYTAGGVCSVSVGDGPSESKVAYSSEDVICRAEEGDNNDV
ncbi:histone-lysine N-methyltransferase ASHH2 [Neltuma alba]|uniref:histone-lysine N-methyltransferase ASHH2 n=1 Tax=Neltuma alba TaxID=207710 RepID=UPI0010A2EDA6|nr:histone-lysine N-methyltransferase ASHH2-like [Prosopis alba]XP_028757560.1 histone-lysine N-methyltransferase ASHH2-like [Prosopis alba]XP_028757561.1 histone-lysine N-methyltransferase ASHH2-like [Prosopis alba]